MRGYTGSIPGLTVTTPVTQLGVKQSPTLSGLPILDQAKQIVVDNPLPALLLIGFLLFK